MEPVKFNFRTLEAPEEEPISLAEAKSHCKVDIPDDDVLISNLIKTAREYLEGRSERAFCTRTLLFTGDGFTERYMGDSWCGWVPPSISGAHRIELNIAPIQSVTSLAYVDKDGTTQTLATGAYVLNSPSEDGPSWVEPAFDTAWPVTRRQSGTVRLTVVAGYGAPAAVPRIAKQAMLLLIGAWYENREAIAAGGIPSEIPLGFEALLAQIRWRIF